MNSQIFTYGEMQKLQENGFTKPGYTFKNRISENGAIFSDQAQIYNILSS
ncbi:hypothetical protein IJM86_03235 [bacterium]|nr:hypothetical protein [bacterium]